MKADKKLPYHVVEKGTGKILDSFKILALAKQHYHVKKGWAEVKETEELKESDDLSALKQAIINKLMR